MSQNFAKAPEFPVQRCQRTAATLWVVTVSGLCFGGGQLLLGGVATLLVVATLWALKFVDLHIPRGQRARLVIRVPETQIPDIDTFIASAGYRAHFRAQRRRDDREAFSITYDIRAFPVSMESKRGSIF